LIFDRQCVFLIAIYEQIKTMNGFSSDKILEIASQTLREESEAIAGLINHLSNDFVETVKLIINCHGRIVVTGIGKSADIGRKFTATLNSTGTPAVFMHAADAIHGDLGTVTSEDIVICLSKSGNTPEIKVLVPLLKGHGQKLIAIVGNTDSYLARQADLVLDTTVQREACPNNLAPTSSTTAQLAMGDALAVALLSVRGFTTSDFAKFHPGGALGKQLYLRVGDVYKNNERPIVSPEQSMASVIVEISSKRLGATAVVDNGKLLGIITDGDLRRTLQKTTAIDHLLAKDIVSPNPQTVSSDQTLSAALEIMRRKNITQLLVVDNGDYLGVIHLHDILKEGII